MNLFERHWFVWLAGLFGWIPVYMGGNYCARDPGEYDCSAPDCLRWEFRPEITS